MTSSPGQTTAPVLLLGRAHLWRMARGRRLQIVRLLVPYSGVLLIVFLPRILSNSSGGNGTSLMELAGQANGVADRYAANIGGAIQLVPMLTGLLAGLGAASVAQTFVSNQRSQGDVEVLLSARYTPAQIVGATIVYTAAVASALWATAIALGTVLTGITLVRFHVGLTPSPWYVFSYIVTPLLTTICAATLACTLCYVIPDRTLSGSGGVTGGRGIIAAAALAPGLVAAFSYILVPPSWIGISAPGVSIGLLLLIFLARIVGTEKFYPEKFSGN